VAREPSRALRSSGSQTSWKRRKRAFSPSEQTKKGGEASGHGQRKKKEGKLDVNLIKAQNHKTCPYRNHLNRSIKPGEVGASWGEDFKPLSGYETEVRAFLATGRLGTSESW